MTRRAPMMRAILVMAALGAAGMAQAQEVPVETGTLGGSQITLHVQPFLTPEELATLRLVMTNEQALAIFVPDATKGFAAMAAAPDEGFIRESKPVASAVAIAGMGDATAAREAAMQGCEAARKEGEPCVTVLEIAPAP
jgi:hypothetical protein